MPIIMPRRQFITGLFAAPAVIAASSLMPVSAGLITKLEAYSDVPSFTNWCLVREGKEGNFAWMMDNQVDKFVNPLLVYDRMKMNIAVDEKTRSELTVELMKKHSAAVIYDIPSTYLR